MAHPSRSGLSPAINRRPTQAGGRWRGRSCLASLPFSIRGSEVNSPVFIEKRALKFEIPHSTTGNGLGIRVVGGKEVPGSNGEIGAYVAKVLPGGATEQTGKILEGEIKAS